MVIIYIFFFLLVLVLLLPTILISVIKSILSIFGIKSRTGRNRMNDSVRNDASYTRHEANDMGSKTNRRKNIFDKDIERILDKQRLCNSRRGYSYRAEGQKDISDHLRRIFGMQ